MRKYLVIFLFLLSNVLAGQEYSVKEFNILSNDMDARISYPVKDFNNKPCGLIKIGVNRRNILINSYPDATVKVENKPAELWVYVMEGTKRLSLIDNEFGKIEYILPLTIESAITYELVINIPKVEEVRVKQKPKTVALIKSDPSGAKVFINGNYRGETPMLVDTIYNSVLDLKITKKHFIDFIQSDTLDYGINYFDSKLVKNEFEDRGFISFGLVFNRNDIECYNRNGLYDLKFGKYSKKGWYANVRLMYDFITGDCSETFSGTEVGISKFRIGGGMIRQLSKRIYFMGGVGYSYRNFTIQEVRSYDWDAVNEEPIITVVTPEKDRSYSGIYLQTGLVLRNKQGLFISIDVSGNIGLYNDTGFKSIDTAFGIGYSWLKK